jgi:protoheme ferro-lyase
MHLSLLERIIFEFEKENQMRHIDDLQDCLILISFHSVPSERIKKGFKIRKIGSEGQLVYSK